MNASVQVTINRLRCKKELPYTGIAILFGALIWFIAISEIIMKFYIIKALMYIAIPIVILHILRVDFLGNMIRISPQQFPQLYALVEQKAKTLGFERMPDVFIRNSNGFIGSLAMRLLGGYSRHVILDSKLIDFFSAPEKAKSLEFVIVHELARHAAGHLNYLRLVIMAPSYFIPFLGPAYRRAYVRTADRIALAIVGDLPASAAAIAGLACGSDVLQPKLNVEAFREQEALVSPVFGVLQEITTFRPRLTRRLAGLEALANTPGFRETFLTPVETEGSDVTVNKPDDGI